MWGKISVHFPPFFRGVFQISITKSLSLLVSTLCNSRFPRYRITILIMHTILWVKSKWCRREIESRHWNCKGSFKYDRVTAHRHHYVFVLCVRKSVIWYRNMTRTVFNFMSSLKENARVLSVHIWRRPETACGKSYITENAVTGHIIEHKLCWMV